jgi:hypothetical protein
MADKKKWAILIYQAGDNNLSEECVFALKEMKKIGTEETTASGATKFVDVVVQFDPRGRGNPTRQFKITKPGGDGDLESDEDTTKRKFETDVGSPQALLDFLCESIEAIKADYYMVVLSGHGGGMDEGFLLRDEERPLSRIPSAVSLQDLAWVFSHTRLKDKLGADRMINILGFDACLMSMTELCYQLRTSSVVEYIVAPEGYSLNSGWPYERVLERLKKEIAPLDLAKFIVNQYINFYLDYHLGGISVDLSVLELKRIGDLKYTVDKLAESLIAALPSGTFRDSLILAHWEAQSYNGEQCVDLYDFCSVLQKRLVKTNPKEVVVDSRCNDVKEAIRDGATPLVKWSCFTGAAFQYSFGVSIYFPWSEFDIAANYITLDFGNDGIVTSPPTKPEDFKRSKWLQFLFAYTKETQRVPREAVTHRFTPPWNRGPEGGIHSMRNPPTNFNPISCEKRNKSRLISAPPESQG